MLENGPLQNRSDMFCQNNHQLICNNFFSIMYTPVLILLHTRTHFLLFPWKLAKNWKFRDSQKICGSTWLLFSRSLAAKSWPFMAKWSLKVCNFKFTGFHGNAFQFWWILGNRHPMGYIYAKFQVSSFNSLSVIMLRTHLRDGLVELINSRYMGQILTDNS